MMLFDPPLRRLTQLTRASCRSWLLTIRASEGRIHRRYRWLMPGPDYDMIVYGLG